MKQYKRANLKLANPGLSNHSRKRKEQNELIVRELQKARLGIWGWKKWFSGN
ncbi:hypothetical protein [Neobacillus fumarioli]|uniref:hypothetical protein n=1 Tax=Neobacillus fumarioli TaxID=105229 RepID=UPI000AA3A65B|nr:hypothetical protein [Neobacillus fumarioli]